MLSADRQGPGIILPVNKDAEIRVEIDPVPFFGDEHGQFIPFQRFRGGRDRVPRFPLGGKGRKKGTDIHRLLFFPALAFRHTMAFNPQVPDVLHAVFSGIHQGIIRFRAFIIPRGAAEDAEDTLLFSQERDRLIYRVGQFRRRTVKSSLCSFRNLR